MDIVSMLSLIVSSTLVFSAPLMYSAIGGTFSEHGGIVNIGLEGIMTMGAFSSIV
ncbi:MAG: ABC transporter permease, partial [Lactobacillus iners]|nr:ABC transporter permease [Lactobacillus iners]MCT7707439.1 ABC transporter permease [Lactobacillus iners]